MTYNSRSDLTATGRKSTLLFSAAAQVQISRHGVLQRSASRWQRRQRNSRIDRRQNAEKQRGHCGAQWSDMRARKYFVNVYTAKFPDGEIRSQLVAK
jgi:hypothetical protein